MPTWMSSVVFKHTVWAVIFHFNTRRTTEKKKASIKPSLWSKGIKTPYQTKPNPVKKLKVWGPALSLKELKLWQSWKTRKEASLRIPPNFLIIFQGTKTPPLFYTFNKNDTNDCF